MNKTLFLFVMFVLSVSFCFSQTKTPTEKPSTPPPGNIQLLFEYTHETRQGIDTQVGEIRKKDGLVIRYDIGKLAGNLTRANVGTYKEKRVWYKRQTINDDELWIAYFSDGKITATFIKASANFYAETKSQEDVADFLLIIMTYRSKDKK